MADFYILYKGQMVKMKGSVPGGQKPVKSVKEGGKDIPVYNQSNELLLTEGQDTHLTNVMGSVDRKEARQVPVGAGGGGGGKQEAPHQKAERMMNREHASYKHRAPSQVLGAKAKLAPNKGGARRVVPLSDYVDDGLPGI